MSPLPEQVNQVVALASLLSDSQFDHLVAALDSGKLRRGDSALAVLDTVGLICTTASGLVGPLRD